MHSDRFAGDYSTSALLEEGTMREAIGMHLGGLPDESVRVLSAASVIGREFSVAVIAAMLGIGISECIGALAEPQRVRIVAKLPGGAHQYRFVHTLIRDVLYKKLTGAERIVAHEKAGDALLALTPQPRAAEIETIARQFAAAAGARVDRAVVWCIRAAEVAGDRGDTSACEAFLEDASTALRLGSGAIPLGEADKRALSELGARTGAARVLAEALRARESATS
jgi:predicted ATPase